MSEDFEDVILRDETRTVLVQIATERSKQLVRFGSELDNKHSPADWWTIVSLNFAKWFPRWRLTDSNEHDVGLLRTGLVKIAAVIVAWIEAIDRRNPDGVFVGQKTTK